MPRNNSRNSRIVPQIHVLGATNNLRNELGTDPKFIHYYYEHLCKGIFDGFGMALEAVVIFEQTNSTAQHSLGREHWYAALQSAKQYYEERESYETCLSIQTLQEKLTA